jgi:hypothetical protein
MTGNEKVKKAKIISKKLSSEWSQKDVIEHIINSFPEISLEECSSIGYISCVISGIDARFNWPKDIVDIKHILGFSC